MADIKTHLNNIKSALYGKDVRGSIHDGIDAINKEVENTTGRQVNLESTFDQLVINAGNSNAEIVDARVKSDGTSYLKLGDRLNEVDLQLKHKANKYFVDVHDFGAKGDYNDKSDEGTDDTEAIQKAIDYAYENNISTVLFDSKGYVIKGQLIIKDGITLKGTRESFTQGLAAHTDNGADRYRITSETSLMVKPNNINTTPFIFNRQSGVKNLSIIQYQNFAATSESQIIKYAPTIIGTHGFNAYNIRFIGAYDFIQASGESIHIEKIYGYALRKAISLSNSADVSRIKDIHLNPNVTRPTLEFIELCRHREGVALEMNNCDVVLIDNFFCILYKTGIRSIGTPGAGQNQFNLNNFAMDLIGLGFDIDHDCGWTSHINNGVVIYGFSNDEYHCGLVKFNKSSGDSIISRLNITNVCANGMTEYQDIQSIKAKYFIYFKYMYSYILNFDNINYDSGCDDLMSKFGGYITGQIRNGNTLYDLSELNGRNSSFIENPRLNDIVDKIPKGWLASTTPSECYKDDSGCTVIKGGSVYYRRELQKTNYVIVRGYLKDFDSNTQIRLTGHSSDWSRNYMDIAEIDLNGYFRIKSSYAYDIFDIQIVSNNTTTSIKKIEAYVGDRSW